MKKNQGLENIFKAYLTQEKLESKKLLLMVSGGVDSRVLLEVATKVCKPEKLAVFHLDHQTRTETKLDFEFVHKLCEAKEIRFFGEQLKNSPKKNKERSWREIRQQLSQKCAKGFGAVRILTAHHATDLAETMIFRLVKGAGAEGLSPFDTSTKPFWKIPKSELEAYAQKNKLVWVEDETNLNTAYERNLIRHQVIPELRKITPNLEKVMVNESIIFEELAAFTEEQLKATFLKVAFREHKILLIEFLSLPAAIQRAFLRKIATLTPSFSELEDTLKWLNHRPKGNSEKTLGHTRLRIEKNFLTWKS